MDLIKIEQSFRSKVLHNEDDVKLHFHTEIVVPLLKELNPDMINQYKSENTLLYGGRTDATFQSISFEFKKSGHFSTTSGIEEALYGRKGKNIDHGLYDYIISNASIEKTDSVQIIKKKLLHGIGVGFDGKLFIFARFINSPLPKKLNTSKLKIQIPDPIPVTFDYEIMDFSQGLNKMALLIKQQPKSALTKSNLISVINSKESFVRDSIKLIYDELKFNLENTEGSNRVRTLYKEWDLVFGAMYGNDSDASGFTEVSSVIKEMYGYDMDSEINSKYFLFSLQTFFNIFLKLLIYSFMAQLINPAFSTQQKLMKADIDRLFDGEFDKYDSFVNNFFESHFMEWFTYSASENTFEEKVVNDTLEKIDHFDLNTFVLKPEEVQDILQEVYMELIPPDMRHLMGEYFSPDWIVEHALDMINYSGDIEKSIIDPTAGSGTFLTHSIKRIIKNHGELKSLDEIKKITNNIIGFDINPISVVSAKANYILVLFSACNKSLFEQLKKTPINIPIYVADSILAPIVYSEENVNTLKIKTSETTFIIPKFSDYEVASEFLKKLSQNIHEKSNFDKFWNLASSLKLIDEEYKNVVKALFDQLYVLHRSGKDSFWPIILRNSFAPILIRNKFDFVIGNPPWIAWKSMSRSYRDGTLEIWKSYGIFEKNAYDKKTVHDDFGMAVTYVAVDQYLKDSGTLVFLLPVSFLKSTKGGEGFRKLSITRKGQNVPFSIDRVDDFSGVNLFTIPTAAIKITKNKQMTYPLHEYHVWNQIGKRSKIDPHTKWDELVKNLNCRSVLAQPVDSNDLQSAWLTMEDLEFANKVLDSKKNRSYSGRKGIEPAGGKGIFVLKKPEKVGNGILFIENDIDRQRRVDFIKKGVHRGKVEETFVYPMLGGRNIDRWKVKSNEFMLVPHTAEYKYGIPETELEKTAPLTYEWLDYYHDELLASRKQNGKYFNPDIHPFYRLDNVGTYTYAPYKVLWKEQCGSMSAVVVSTYNNSIPNAECDLFSEDKIIVIDSKVLMLGLDNEEEAYYVCGIINSNDIISIIDSYAISTNRGTDVLKYIAIPKYDQNVNLHREISSISKMIHRNVKEGNSINELEKKLNESVRRIFD